MTTERLQLKQNKVLHVALKDLLFSLGSLFSSHPSVPFLSPSPFVLGLIAHAPLEGSDNRKRNPPLYTVQTIIIEKGYIWPPWQ